MSKEARNRGSNSRKNDCRTQKSLKDTVSALGQASGVAGNACQRLARPEGEARRRRRSHALACGKQAKCADLHVYLTRALFRPPEFMALLVGG